MTKQTEPADSEIHEDQLLNFLVNVLTGAFTLNLGENAEIDPEDLDLLTLSEERRRSLCQ